MNALQADEVVVNKGLEHNEKERHALRDKPGSVSSCSRTYLEIYTGICDKSII